MCAAVWEAALRQLIGDSSIMRGQLEHLLDVAGLKNVRLEAAGRCGSRPAASPPTGIPRTVAEGLHKPGSAANHTS
ncbi:Scr1 family TA system antitoxin-like transcriptional regulator [Streptomyces olivaceus]|uniref:Scr1 family TA system antitoxin-like transcriptional regulator n=1 Tax=Streptomyces olivaceus TaxID=47716 RepID=UPI003820DF43